MYRKSLRVFLVLLAVFGFCAGELCAATDYWPLGVGYRGTFKCWHKDRGNYTMVATINSREEVSGQNAYVLNIAVGGNVVQKLWLAKNEYGDAVVQHCFLNHCSRE